jgi:hypothetical protein
MPSAKFAVSCRSSVAGVLDTGGKPPARTEHPGLRSSHALPPAELAENNIRLGTRELHVAHKPPNVIL